MIKILLTCILAICGLFFLLAPKKYLVNLKKIKDEATIEKNVKNSRIASILFLLLTLLDFFVL